MIRAQLEAIQNGEPLVQGDESHHDGDTLSLSEEKHQSIEKFYRPYQTKHDRM